MKRAAMKRKAAMPVASAKQRQITTPEGLVLTLTLASRGARLGALLLDLMLMGGAMVALVIAVIFTAGGMVQLGRHIDGRNAGDHAIQFLLVVLIAGAFLLRNGWFLAFELGPRGATPGKRIMKIRVAARDGRRLSADMVIARNLLRDIEIFLPFSALGAVAAGGQGAAPVAVAAAAWLALWAGFVFF
ncbi:MAG TPA: RDD family protein, partial [Novosphingobium sp.]|nr:RDD family protein [Novosphingobium sp.]